jgi:flagellar hook-length control protein FliK
VSSTDKPLEPLAEATELAPVTTQAKPAPVQTPPTTPVATATAAATTDGRTTAAAVETTQSTTESSASDAPSTKLAAKQKQDAASVEVAAVSAIKRLSAIQPGSSNSTPTSAATTSTQSVEAPQLTDDQPAATKQESKAAPDKAPLDLPPQSAALQSPTSQPTPVAAAVAPTNPASQTATTETITSSGTTATTKVGKITGPQTNATLAAFGRTDRSGSLTAAGPRQSGDASNTPTIDPARFVSRVARALETAQERGGPLNLRLSPPELGAMRLQLEVKQGVMTAKVETDTAAARQALLDNLPALRERLADHNVRIDRFDVDVRRDGTGENAAQNKQHQQFQQQYNQTAAARLSPTTIRTADTATSETAPPDRIITSTTINLVA